MSFYIHSDLPFSQEVASLNPAMRADCIGLWAAVGSWAARKETGGIVSRNALKYLRAPSRFADELVRVDLWQSHVDGYEFYGASAAYSAVDMNSMRRPKPMVTLKYCKLPSKAYFDWHKQHAAKTHRKIPKQVREEVVNTHGMTCWLCGGAIVSNANLHLDHVVPHAFGGAETVDNLRPAHARCNVSRGARPVDEFRKHLADAAYSKAVLS